MPYSCDKLTLSGAVCYQLLLISHAAKACCCRTDLKICGMYVWYWLKSSCVCSAMLSQAEGFVEGLGFVFEGFLFWFEGVLFWFGFFLV